MMPAVNFAEGTLEPAREMLQHPNTLYALGDGGAHLGFLCDASLPTYMLQYWSRDRVKGPRIELPEVIHRLTQRNADAIGLKDRGVLKVGTKADINVIDLERVNLHSPRVVFDLPAGGRRVTQDSEGYDATIVSGVVIQRNGKDTGARPGRLVRGAQAATA
jgi:N-acyl-D-aspartate/D-glutamate deacylase